MRGSDLSSYSTFKWIMGAPDLPAERRRGATLAITRKPKDAKSGRSASTLTPYPWLVIVVVASLGVLFALAVVGAYALIRAVVGRAVVGQ